MWPTAGRSDRAALQPAARHATFTQLELESCVRLQGISAPTKIPRPGSERCVNRRGVTRLLADTGNIGHSERPHSDQIPAGRRALPVPCGTAPRFTDLQRTAGRTHQAPFRRPSSDSGASHQDGNCRYRSLHCPIGSSTASAHLWSTSDADCTDGQPAQPHGQHHTGSHPSQTALTDHTSVTLISAGASRRL